MEPLHTDDKLTLFRQMSRVGLEGQIRAHQGERSSVYQKVGIVVVCICLPEEVNQICT